MTFDEFRATGKDVPDMRDIPEIASQLSDYDPPRAIPGRVYGPEGDAIYYIERNERFNQYTLTLDRSEFTCTVGNDSRSSRDLARLERMLYDWLNDEGFLPDTPADKAGGTYAQIISQYPNFKEWHTGGGCMAHSHPLPNGGYILITDDSNIPADNAQVVTCGRYGPDGDALTLEDEACFEIPVEKLEKWIDAAIRECTPHAYWSRVMVDALEKEWERYCHNVLRSAGPIRVANVKNEEQLTHEQRAMAQAYEESLVQAYAAVEAPKS